MSLLTPFVQLCLVTLVARLGYQMARSPVLPRFAQELGAAPEMIGLILGASTLTGVIGKLPAGALSDVVGRKRVMVLGALFFAGPPFLYPFIDQPMLLLALRFVHGMATAIFSPVASAAVAGLFQKDRGERLGWFSSVGELGGAAGPVLGGILLVTTGSFAWTYLVVGVLGVLALVLTLGLPIEEQSGGSRTVALVERSHQFWNGIREIGTDRTVLIASGTEACLFLGVGALVGFLPLYARDHGLTEAHVGLILGAQIAVAMVSKPMTGRFSDQVGRKPLIVAGMLCCIIVLPFIFQASSFPALLILCMIFGLGMALVTPSTTALVADLCKSGRHGAAMGVFGSIWDVGEASGPILAGILVTLLGYGLAFATVAAIMSVGVLVFVALVKDPQHAYATHS